MTKKELVEIIEDCVYNSQVLIGERVCFDELRKELNEEVPEQLILSGVSHRRELLREYNNFNNERIYGGELTDFEIDCFMDSRNSG